MDGLTTIHLGGKLGSLFGKEWKLLVSSPAEAVRAIDINLGGKLRRYLRTEGAKKFYKIAVGRKDNLLDKTELTNRSGQTDIYILPTVRGAGSGAGKIIAGLAIIALAVFVPAVGAYVGATFGTTAGAASLGIGLLGASLVLGGVTQLLTPTPNFNQDSSSAETDGSTIFNGNATAIAQGGAVGIVYGRALVTPMPVCISFTNQDITLSNGQRVTTDAGKVDYCQVTLEGGGYQFVPRDENGECP